MKQIRVRKTHEETLLIQYTLTVHAFAKPRTFVRNAYVNPEVKKRGSLKRVEKSWFCKRAVHSWCFFEIYKSFSIILK